MKRILIILSLIFLLTTVFSASSFVDFNIENDTTYITATSSTLSHTISADINCEVCFSQTNDNTTCTPKASCTSGNTAFTLSSGLGVKTVYAFLYDNNTYVTNASDDINYVNPTPSCTITSPTVTDSNTTAITFTFSCTDAATTQAKIDSNVITSGTSLSTYLIPNVSHTLYLDANGVTGSAMTQVTAAIMYDTNAPTSGTISFSGWTNADKPTLTISASHHSGTSKILFRLSCMNLSGDTNWSAWVTYATSYSDFNINSPSNGCIIGDSNKTIYAQFKDTVGNIDSNTYRGTVLYDNVAPSTPTSVSATAGNAKATVSWTAPSADNNSGNAGYKVYKGGTYHATTTSTSYEVTGLTNGTSYCFKVSTYDNAGNESVLSSEQCATPQATSASITIKRDGSVVSYAKNGDILTVTCTYSSSASGAKIRYAYFGPNTTAQSLKESSSSVDSLTENVTINTSTTAYAQVGFWCEASGSSGTGVNYVNLDNSSPTVSWKDDLANFSGTTRISVTATDNTAIGKVDFNFNNLVYNSTKDSGNVNAYFIDLNTLPFENGQYNISAISYDTALNKTIISKTITLENIQTPKQKAQKMISDAKIKQKTANDMVNYFGEQGLVIPAALNEKKKSADSLIAEAEKELGTNAEGALTKATQANALLEEFNNSAKVETIETKNYNYDSNTLLADLKKLGFDDARALKAIELMNQTGVERKLVIVKAGTQDKRQVRIEITFTNDTNETLLKLIEVIPKELLDSARKIVSDTNFRIVQEDPIIEFTIPAKSGEKITLSYGLGEISKEDANKIISNNLVAKFATLPIIVPATTKTEEVVGSAIFSGIIQFVIILAIILIILLVLAGVFFIKFKHPKDGHGMGEEKTVVEHLTPPKEEEKPKWSAP